MLILWPPRLKWKHWSCRVPNIIILVLSSFIVLLAILSICRTSINYFENPFHLFQTQLYHRHKATQEISNTKLYHHFRTLQFLWHWKDSMFIYNKTNNTGDTEATFSPCLMPRQLEKKEECSLLHETNAFIPLYISKITNATNLVIKILERKNVFNSFAIYLAMV